MNKILVNKYLEQLKEIESLIAALETEMSYEKDLKQKQCAMHRLQAKEKGVVYGRPKKELGEEFYKVCSLIDKGEISKTYGCELLNMKKSTFYKHYKDYKDNK